jgi:hypothetical protein
MKHSLLALAVVLMTAPAFGASRGYQQSTSLSTASAANLPSIPTGGAASVLISVEASGVRWRDDGTDPTSTVGQPVSAGQALCYANEVGAFRVIGQTAGATINVTYYAGKGCAQ